MYHKEHIEFEHGVKPWMTPRFYRWKPEQNSCLPPVGDVEDIKNWAYKYLNGTCGESPFGLDSASLRERLDAIARHLEPAVTASRWEVDPDRLKGEDFWKARIVDDETMLFAVVDEESFRAIVEDVPERVQSAVNCCESTSEVKFLVAEIEEIAEIYRELADASPLFVAYFDNGGDGDDG